MTRTALITGIGGQDGSYLAERLLADGHAVHGVVRDAAKPLEHLAAVRDRLAIHEVDLTDAAAVGELVARVAPDRIFHLAAHTFVGGDTNTCGMGDNVSSTMALLEAVRAHAPRARLCLAGSATQHAGAATSPQSEATPPAPTTTYGLSKVLAADAVRFFRERHGVFASVAVLYNHESERRPERFFTMKVCRAAARIAAGLERTVDVGDLDAVRDWGYAPEYVDAMARMLELQAPADLVLATGVGHTVRAWAERAFAVVGLRAADHLVVKPELLRGKEAVALVGDASKAARVLGWRAQVSFDGLVERMVRHEVARLASSTKPR